MRYSDHHQEEAQRRRELRRQREYDAERARKSSKPPQSTGRPVPYQPKHEYSPPVSRKGFFDYLFDYDATKPGFWAWLTANEVRFLYGLLWMGFIGILAVLLLVRLLDKSPIDDLVFYDSLLVALVIVAAVMTLPLLVAYAMFHHQCVRKPKD